MMKQYNKLMKNLVCLVCIISIMLFFIFPISSFSEGRIILGHLTGNDYMKLSKDYKSLYIVAVIDGIFIANDLLPKPAPHLSYLINYTKDMESGQLVAIVDKWMNENPREWHQMMNALVVMALMPLR